LKIKIIDGPTLKVDGLGPEKGFNIFVETNNRKRKAFNVHIESLAN